MATGVLGCAPDKTGLGTLYDVTGEVSFKGEPTPGAIVEFVPKDEATEGKPSSRAIDAPRTFAVVGEDGNFTVATVVPEGTKRGAPAGEYLITVTWTKPLDPGDKDSTMSPNLLPAKYKDPTTSTLEFEVVSGTNVMPPITIEP